MSETSNLKIVAPDASSVLVPLHAHFKGLADTVDQAIVDRFQVKNLSFETTTARDLVYTETTGQPTAGNTDKPALVDGDVCYVRENKRYFVWNENSGNDNWMQISKRLYFASAAARDSALAEDIAQGDTCYVADSGLDFVWDGSSWKSATSVMSPKAIVASAFYGPAVFGTSQATQLLDRIYYTSFYVPTKGTYDAYNAHVVTAGTSSSITMALYNSSPTTGLPTSKITGSDATATTNSSASAPIPTMGTAAVLQPGWYWIGTFVDGSAMPVMVSTAVGAAGGGGFWMPRTSAYSATNLNSPELYDTTYTTNTPGTMPANAGGIASGSGTRSPIVSVRKSA